MTLMEFSIKYDVPYIIVYESSYNAKSYETFRKDREYDEDDLKKAVKILLTKRMNRHIEIAKKQEKYLESIKGGNNAVRTGNDSRTDFQYGQREDQTRSGRRTPLLGK